MHTETRSVCAKCIELLFCDPSFKVKSRVLGEGGMSLGKNEAIPVGVSGLRNIQNAVVENGHDIGDGQGRTDVAHMSASRLLKDRALDVGRSKTHEVQPVALQIDDTIKAILKQRNWWISKR